MPPAKAGFWLAPVPVYFSAGPNAALLTLPDVAIFIADVDYELVQVDEIHETLGTDGGAVTLDIVKCTGTQAASAGTSMLATTFNLKATINTVVSKKLSGGGLATSATTRRLLAGNRLAINFAGTMTAVTGVCVTAWLRRLDRPTY